MWLMMQQPKPDDFVIATGEARKKLDWKPKGCFKEWVRMMAEAGMAWVHQQVYGLKGKRSV